MWYSLKRRRHFLHVRRPFGWRAPLQRRTFQQRFWVQHVRSVLGFTTLQSLPHIRHPKSGIKDACLSWNECMINRYVWIRIHWLRWNVPSFAGIAPSDETPPRDGSGLRFTRRKHFERGLIQKLCFAKIPEWV